MVLFLIQAANLCLLIWAFILLILKVIIDKNVLMIVLLLVYYLISGCVCRFFLFILSILFLSYWWLYGFIEEYACIPFWFLYIYIRFLMCGYYGLPKCSPVLYLLFLNGESFKLISFYSCNSCHWHFVFLVMSFFVCVCVWLGLHHGIWKVLVEGSN